MDRCAGRRLADWLARQGHDVREARERTPEPGDLELLRWAASDARILVTIDTDFGFHIFRAGEAHAGIVRLPDVPANERISLMADLLGRYSDELEAGAVLTLGRDRVRVSRPQPG